MNFVYVDIVKANVATYKIHGSNFYKLRDVCQSFDIGVECDNATQHVDILLDESYVEEGAEQPPTEDPDARVVGWSIGSHLNADLVNTVLDEVIANLPDGCHPTVHLGRWFYYRWPKWIKRMKKAWLTRSMSKKECSTDNAVCDASLAD